MSEICDFVIHKKVFNVYILIYSVVCRYFYLNVHPFFYTNNNLLNLVRFEQYIFIFLNIVMYTYIRYLYNLYTVVRDFCTHIIVNHAFTVCIYLLCRCTCRLQQYCNYCVHIITKFIIPALYLQNIFL